MASLSLLSACSGYCSLGLPGIARYPVWFSVVTNVGALTSDFTRPLPTYGLGDCNARIGCFRAMDDSHYGFALLISRFARTLSLTSPRWVWHE